MRTFAGPQEVITSSVQRGILVLAVAATIHLASAQPASIDSTAQGPLNGFELYGNGYYWWNDGFPASETIPARIGQIAVRSLVAGSGLVQTSTKPVFALQSESLRAPYQSVARNDDSLFYFFGPVGNLHLYKRAIYGPSPAQLDFSGASYSEPGAVLLAGSVLYWNVRGGAAPNGGEIRFKNINGPFGSGDSTLRAGMGLITKMKIIRLVEEDGNAGSSYLFMLNTLGQLWHIRLPGLIDPLPGPLTFYAGDVADFDARDETESRIDPPFIRRIHGTRLYAATGVSVGNNRATGKLYSFNLTSGGTVVEHDTANINVQVTAVALDSQRIFITRTPLVFTVANVWEQDPANASIWRKDSTPNRDVSSPDFSFVFSNQEGRNLRSDTQWVYYAHQHQLRRFKTDSPAQQIDVRAVGLEVVQAVQDFRNSVPIVAKKPTFARGYAQVVINTSGRSRLRLHTRLRAARDGTPLPGEVYSEARPVVDDKGDLPSLRADLKRAFTFQLPDAWLAEPGNLRVEMMVNADGTEPENNFANNFAVANVSVAPARVPCVVFKPLSSSVGEYNLDAPDSGFWDIIDRAQTLLPVSGFHVRVSQGSVTKPVFTFLGIKQRTFTMPDDKDWVLPWMTLAHAFSRDPDGCDDTHWVGMLPSAVAGFNGIAGARGMSLSDLWPDTPIDISFPRTALDETAVVRMELAGGTPGSPWSTVRGGFSLAHELGHNYGRFHIDQTRMPGTCGGDRPDGPWHIFPGDPCRLGVTDLNDSLAPIGFDAREAVLITPDKAADLMTYRDSRWISPFTWNILLGAIPPHVPPGFVFGKSSRPKLNPQPLPPGGIYFVQGLIDPVARQVAMMPAFQVTNGILNDAKVQESLAASVWFPPSAPYRARLLGSTGTVLDDRALVPLPTSEHGGKLAFAQALPNVAGATRMQILEGATVLTESSASPNAPTLTLNSPLFNATTETLSLSWNAQDADGDPLLFTVQFSPNNGVSWDPVLLNDPATSLSLGTRLLPGGNACRLRVLATDGFRTAVAVTDPFTLPKHNPVITISGLRPEQEVAFNSKVIARAFAYDAENGSIDPAAILWRLVGPELHTNRGPTLPLQGLAPGAYALTASTTDLEGNLGGTSFTFRVRPIEIPNDASVPIVDGFGDDAAYATGAQLQLSPGPASPSVQMVHAGGALYLSFEGLALSDPNSAAANINFYIDGDGVTNIRPQTSDVGFGVDENGVPARARGTGAGWTSELPQGFEVKLFRGSNTWNAEFRVPDSELGGWNRNAAITFYFASTPGAALHWPVSSDVFNPAGWSGLRFGTLPAPSNRPPVAVAFGPALVSFTGTQTVTLNASGSYDPDGDTLSFTWIQISGPPVSLQNANTSVPTFVTPVLTATTPVSFRLVVSDAHVSSAPSDISVVLAPAGLASGGGQDRGPVSVNPTNGSANVLLEWPGVPGNLAIIQASRDLIQWTNIATNSVGFLRTLLYTDLQAGQHPYRFYRAAGIFQSNVVHRAELSFDGVDDHVEVPHAAALNALPLTITAWFRTSQTEGEYPEIISKFDPATDSSFAVALDLGRLTCWYFNAGDRFVWDGGGPSMPFVADGQWHHVAFAVSSAGGRVYLDGSLLRSTDWIGAPGAVQGIAPVRFGGAPATFGYFRGDIDEVALWNRSLTAADVNQLMPGELSGNELGLLGCWKFNEGAGLVAADLSGQGRTGTLRNGPLWFASTAPLRPNPVAGTALRFDGSNDSVRVPHNATLNAFPLTIAGWVKTAQNTNGYVAIANKYTPGSANGYSLHMLNGRVAGFYFRNGTSFLYSGDPGLDGGFIADGRWHHVAYTVDTNGARIYLDGVMTGSLGWTGTPGACTTTTPLMFGLYPFPSQTISLDGRLDEMSLWNRSLDASEVNVLLNFKLEGSENGLIGYWPFDNASGTVATEVSGHGGNGELQNGTGWVPSDAPINP